MKVYCLGDSLSNNTYESTLQTLLGGTWTVVEKGNDSERTDQMLARLDADVITPGDADYCVVMGGVNDIYQGYSASSVESNLQDIYDALHAANIKVVACAIMPWNGSEVDVKTINTWIQNTATNVDYFIDSYKTVNNQASDGNIMPMFDSGDHTHLSTAGYNALAQAIYSGMGVTDGKIELLIVAGGGGGAWAGGGGGAGGLIYRSSYGVSFDSPYTVTIGAKGGGGVSNNGTTGGDSVFDSNTAKGGGGGGKFDSTQGLSGGSAGGGAAFSGIGGVALLSGAQGNNGGAATGVAPYGAGGGGGAGSVGGDYQANAGGLGGSGLRFDISGSDQYYAGGGGGSSNGGVDAAGGSSIGGTGSTSTIGGNAVADTGSGGGGGCGSGSNGGNGSDGIVIIRYLTSDFGDLTGGTKTTSGSYTIHTFKYADTGTSIEFTEAPVIENRVKTLTAIEYDWLKKQTGVTSKYVNEMWDQYYDSLDVETDQDFLRNRIEALGGTPSGNSISDLWKQLVSRLKATKPNITVSSSVSENMMTYYLNT